MICGAEGEGSPVSRKVKMPFLNERHFDKINKRLEGLNLENAHYLIKLDNYIYAGLFEKKRSRVFEKLMMVSSRLGDGYGWILLAALLFFASVIHPGITRAIVTYYFLKGIISTLFCIILFVFVKTSVNRKRPYTRHMNKMPLLKAPDKYSFPSGHTMVAFSMIFTLGMSSLPSLVYAVLLAILIAVSRIFVGVHYPLDVFAGAVMGSCVGIGTNFFFLLFTAAKPMIG